MAKTKRRRGKILKGKTFDPDEADWGPLENVIAFDVCDDFMHMEDRETFDPERPSQCERVQLQQILTTVLGYPSWPAVEERMKSERWLTEERAKTGDLKDGEPYPEDGPF